MARARTPQAEHALRLAAVRGLERAFKRATDRGDAVKVTKLRGELRRARELLSVAEDKLKGAQRRNGASTRSAPRPRLTIQTARAVRQQAVGRQLLGTAAPESTAPTRVFSDDPDANKRTVWIFKTGNAFHRRDCQIVECRDGAFEVPISRARRRNLVRCMHCVPTVR